MRIKMYPKQTLPKEAHCPHCYWAYIERGDDVEKECFCDVDDKFCFGNNICVKKKRASDE